MPNCSRTPCRIGSGASRRVPRRAAWMPTRSAVQWSTAKKIVAVPSVVVTVEVASVPRIALDPSVTMVRS